MSYLQNTTPTGSYTYVKGVHEKVPTYIFNSKTLNIGKKLMDWYLPQASQEFYLNYLKPGKQR